MCSFGDFEEVSKEASQEVSSEAPHEAKSELKKDAKRTQKERYQRQEKTIKERVFLETHHFSKSLKKRLALFAFWVTVQWMEVILMEILELKQKKKLLLIIT